MQIENVTEQYYAVVSLLFHSYRLECAERVQWIVKPNLLFLSITFVGNELPNDVCWKFASIRRRLRASAPVVESRDGRKRVALNGLHSFDISKFPLNPYIRARVCGPQKYNQVANGDYIATWPGSRRVWVRVGWC